MSYIARLRLLCGIGAEYHLKKTAELCKKIAKSFVKPNLEHPSAPFVHRRDFNSIFSMAPRGLIRQDLSAADHQPAPMLTS